MDQEKILTSPEVASSRYRSLGGIARWIERCLLITMILIGVLYLLDLHIYLRWTIFPTQYYGIFGFGSLHHLLDCSCHGESAPKLCSLVRYRFAVLGFTVGSMWPSGGPSSSVLAMWWLQRDGCRAIAVPLCIEAVRRVVGLSFTVIAVAMVLFVRFGYLVPVIYFGRSVSWQYLMQYLYLDTSALFGIVIGVVSDMVLGFILFGSLLMQVKRRCFGQLCPCPFWKICRGPCQSVSSDSLSVQRSPDR
jgi:hypothetical protein